MGIGHQYHAPIGNEDRQREEIERLRRWISDLQSRLYVNCVYCGHRYGPEADIAVSRAELLKQHIACCPEHPMSKLVTALKAASHALRSYQYGNSATDLAAEAADHVDATLAEVEPQP